MRLRPLAINVALALVSVAVFLVAAEVAVRVFVPRLETRGVYSRPTDAPYGYELVPGAEAIVSSRPVRINAHGFRDRERTVEKPAGTRRIVLLGDSHAFGEGVRDDEIASRVLEESLRAALPETPVEVLNLGVFGFNTTQEVHLLEHRGLAYDPDLVIVLYTLSDVMSSLTTVPPFHRLAEPGRAVDGSGVPPAALARDAGRVDEEVSAHERRFGRLGRFRSLVRRSALARLVFYRLSTLSAMRALGGSWETLYRPDSPGWLEARAALRHAAALRRRHGFELLVAIHPELVRLDDYPHAAAHRTIRVFCEREGIPVLDLYPAYATHEATELWIHPEDRHPNARGHRIIAEALAEYLLSSRGWLS